MTKVLILGSGGMLGSMVAQVLEENPDFEITTSQRGDGDTEALRFDAERSAGSTKFKVLPSPQELSGFASPSRW
jgi:hypothetical protein